MKPLAKKANQCQEHTPPNFEKYIRWLTTLSLIRLAIVASRICEIPRNSPKIRTYSSRSSILVSIESEYSLRLPISHS